MEVSLISFGGGDEKTTTAAALKKLAEAEVIIGAKRLLDGVPKYCTGEKAFAVKAEDILKILRENDAKKGCVLLSGDCGFFSGAKKLIPLLEDFDVKLYGGVSSVQLFAARLGVAWEQWRLVSAHGLECNPINEVNKGKDVFFLTGGSVTPTVLCRRLCEAGLGKLKVCIGENLSYEDEKIWRGAAEDFSGQSFSPLSVMVCEKAPKTDIFPFGISDELFIRGSVPMTKREVRAAVISLISPKKEDVIWDVGAGTGSVSVELALAAEDGRVYAVECDGEACSLIEKNREKFCAWNMSVIKGKAPSALENLPSPNAVFIGGSKGETEKIIETALEKNPNVRIVVTAIALESLFSAVESLKKFGFEPSVTQISVSRTKNVGPLNLLMANNPVFIVSGGRNE